MTLKMGALNQSGVLVVDKPGQISSAKMVALVKDLLKARKAGHAGTLDPMATGVLVCCLNQATRLATFFIDKEKTYEAVLRLGLETDTQDSTGKPLGPPRAVVCAEKEIEAALTHFKGASLQLPPVYSALKHKGVALYKLARAGKPVQKPARAIFISEIKLMEVRLPEVRFRTTCSAGTYIRTLCTDIGKRLECGGHLSGLRRTKSSGFDLSQAHSLSAIEKLAAAGRLTANLISMNDALPHMPQCTADVKLARKVRHGSLIDEADVQIQNPPSGDGALRGGVKIVNVAGQLLAIVEFDPNKRQYRYCCSFANDN